MITGVAGKLFQGRNVLGEATTAVSNPCPEEVWPDAVVQAHAVGDGGDIGAHGFAYVGDLIDEGYFRGQKCVGSVLDHLGRGHVRFDDVRTAQAGVETGHSIADLC
ncbi:MAG: hypothetical protein BWY79_01567 [Actinobacteria bacterium ADurb.Bin444]|nr:MAG: hypothetical protein BWY79_01567 [Actinobacteria bacterium ADurb.Bin444]